MPWCSGYLICLTSRRSPVQAWVASVFLPFDIFCVFFTSPVKNKKPIKIFFDTRSFKQWIKTYRSSFQKKNFLLHKNNKNTICYSISPWTNNLMKRQLTIHIFKCEMILSSKLLNLILHFKLFFQVWEGNDQKKLSKKKQKIRSINRTVFTTNVAQVLLRSTL